MSDGWPDGRNWCQRWRDGASRWRPAGELIEPSRYTVLPIGEACAKRFVEDHHYSGSYPAAKLRYGLFEDGRRLVGVAVFSVPSQASVLSNPFPTLRPYDESLELGRFVLLDEVAGNGETFFLARCFRRAREARIRGVVSYSDPVPRSDARGREVFRGHRGTIYLAANCLRAGRSTPRTLKLLPDGSVLSARAISKLRRRERGEAYVARLLVRHGAPPAPAGADEAGHLAWVEEALEAVGVRSLRHPGNLRFLFPLDRQTRSETTRLLAGTRGRERDDFRPERHPTP